MDEVIDLQFQTKSFSRRIFFAFVPFTIFIALSYTLLIDTAIYEVEDRVVSEYMLAELHRIKMASEIHGIDTPLPRTGYLSSFWSTSSDVPEEFTSLAPGIYEFLDDDKPIADMNVVIGDLGPDLPNVILVLEESEFSSVTSYQGLVESTLWIAFGLVVLSGAALAALISKKLSEPLALLTESVSDPLFPKANFYGEHRNDEIGKLSRAFSTLTLRLEDSIEREASFTRHASHELRTPLAVLENSFSLLKLKLGPDNNNQEVLHRISAAIQKTKRLTETFLFLGRETGTISTVDLDLETQTLENLEQYREQTEERNIKIRVSNNAEQAHVTANRLLLDTVLDNLIRNAITYSKENIEVHISDNVIAIDNDICHAASARNLGFGYGEEIVARVSNRCGWIYQKRIHKGHYKATIIFQKTATGTAR